MSEDKPENKDKGFDPTKHPQMYMRRNQNPGPGKQKENSDKDKPIRLIEGILQGNKKEKNQFGNYDRVCQETFLKIPEDAWGSIRHWVREETGSETYIPILRMTLEPATGRMSLSLILENREGKSLERPISDFIPYKPANQPTKKGTKLG